LLCWIFSVALHLGSAGDIANHIIAERRLVGQFVFFIVIVICKDKTLYPCNAVRLVKAPEIVLKGLGRDRGGGPWRGHVWTLHRIPYKAAFGALVALFPVRLRRGHASPVGSLNPQDERAFLADNGLVNINMIPVCFDLIS